MPVSESHNFAEKHPPPPPTPVALYFAHIAEIGTLMEGHSSFISHPTPFFSCTLSHCSTLFVMQRLLAATFSLAMAPVPLTAG